VDDTMTYRYREEKGFIASVVIDNNTFTGHHLKALANASFRSGYAARRKTLYPYRPEAVSWRQAAKEPRIIRQFMPRVSADKRITEDCHG
jgi:DNA repair protein RecO (recombination protein O)